MPGASYCGMWQVTQLSRATGHARPGWSFVGVIAIADEAAAGTWQLRQRES